MADLNGTAEQNGVQAAIDYAHSVKKQDFTRDGVVQFVIPTFTGYEGQSRFVTLPDTLPPTNRTAFFQYRDIISLVTPYYESMWSAAINVAITKAAAWGWEVESPVPLRQKRIQQILLNGTAYVFSGWVNFISAHLRSFLLTGKAFVEIERESHAYGSRIVAIHHLNPLRCRVTDDPEIPVEYYDRKGKIHQLKYWQVMMFADMLDPTEGEYGIAQSSVSRGYDRILLNAAISRFLYEKVSGKRPLALHFVQGTTSRHLEDYIGSMDADQARKGGVAYMGAAIIPIPGDNPVQLITVPLAELPNGFDAQNLRDDAYLIYAKSIGLDPNDIDPRIASARNLGAGAQSVVLAEKAKGQGLAAWRKQWEHAVNNWVADSATTFSWTEENTEDQLKVADLKMKRAQTRDLMIKSGEISPPQARNLAVDAGDLPREFLEEDVTSGGALSDTEKPVEDTPEGREQMERATMASPQAQPAQNGQQPPNGQPQTPQPEQKPTSQQKARTLLQREKEASDGLVEALGLDLDTYKHLAGAHNQARHAWRFGGNEASSTPARRSMTATPEKTEREEYKKRARQRLGMPEKPERKPGERGTKPDKQTVADPKEAMRQKAIEARGKIEKIEREHEAKAKTYEAEVDAIEKDISRLGGEMRLHASGSPEYNRTHEELMQKIEDGWKKRQEMHDALNANGGKLAKMRQELQADTPASVKVQGAEKFGKGDSRRKAIDDGVGGFTRMVDKSVVPEGAVANFKKAGKGRASAWQNDINMTTGVGSKTVVHELGHWLENNNPAVRDAAYRFLDRRTQGEPDRWLGDITGVRSYGRSERAKADQFISAYMGKQYFDRSGRRYGSEILSMGLEMFYSDPVKLARQDPDYFDFIYGIVRGVEL